VLDTTVPAALEHMQTSRPKSEEVLALAQRVEEQVISEIEKENINIKSADDADALISLIRRTLRTYEGGSSFSLTPELISHLTSYIWSNLKGAGPLEPLLRDENIWEIEIVAPNRVFIRRSDGRRARVYLSFYDDSHVQRVVARMLDRSLSTNKKLDPALGIQDSQLEDGSRIHIVHPELAAEGHMLINIRKFATTEKITLFELGREGFLSPESCDYLTEAARSGASIVISGAPGSGKTTVLKAILNSLPSSYRIVSAEEVLELRCKLPNFAQMQTRPRRPERPEIELRTLTNAFLRMTPDVVVIGEVRDRETLPFLMTLSTGVQGLTSLHARSARHALERLRLLAQLSERPITASSATQLVGDCLDLVVHCARQGAKVGVKEIVSVEDPQLVREEWLFSTTTLFERSSLFEPLEENGHAKLTLGARTRDHQQR
jgi:pilus assembly protein CpaF